MRHPQEDSVGYLTVERGGPGKHRNDLPKTPT